MNKLKEIFFKPTNTIPFMLGLFIGMTIIDPNIIQNSFLTATGGGTFHVIKVLTSIHS